MDIGPYLGPIVTATVAVFGFYGMVGQRLAKLEQKLDDYAQKVDKHNNVVERTAILERDFKAMWRRYDEVNDRMLYLEHNGPSAPPTGRGRSISDAGD